MESENKLQRLVVLFQNLNEMESSCLEDDIGQAYFMKNITTELREIIMILYFSTDLLALSQYIADDSRQEYYNMAYGRINTMNGTIAKNLKVMQTMCTYVKHVDALRYIDDAVQLIQMITQAIEKSIDAYNSDRDRRH